MLSQFHGIRGHRPLRTDSAGFGLVELLVSIFLLTIVLAIVSHVLLDGWSGSKKLELTRGAQASASEGLDQLADELRAARSPDRDNLDVVNTRDDLRQRLTESPSPTADVRDITVASDTQIAFRVDAIQDAPGTNRTECVWYHVVAGTSLTHPPVLYRDVFADWRQCPNPSAAPIEHDEIATLSPNLPAQPFSYSEMVATSTPESPACSRQTITPAASPGTTTLNRIVNVAYSFNASKYAKENGDAFVKGSVDLRGRLDSSYLYAIGCTW